MLVMNFGTKITKRTGGSGLRSRTYYQVPNALAWPMLSFPAGYSADADGLPISVQFWGPRFSEPQIIQAAIDYQAAYPDYHRAVPKDPVVTVTTRSKAQPIAPGDVAPFDPFYSNDPEQHEAAIPDALRPH
jgi:hypothetical protein